MAKCSIHGKEIIAHCFKCGEPLCEDCVMKKVKGRYYCFRCAIEESLVNFEKEEKKIEKLRRERELYLKGKKKTVSRLRIAMFIMLGLAVVEGVFYSRLYLERKRSLNENYLQYINTNIDFINMALKNYSRLNNGEYPNKLSELIPQYLPEFKLSFLLSKELSYKKDRELGYLLSWTGSFGGRRAKIVVAKTGRIIDTLSPVGK